MFTFDLLREGCLHRQAAAHPRALDSPRKEADYLQDLLLRMLDAVEEEATQATDGAAGITCMNRNRGK